MRRAACGDTEIPRKLRHFAHELDKTVMAAAGNSRFTLFFDGPAHFVAASQSVNVRAVFGQPREKMREILQLVGDDMDDTAFLLHNTDNRHVTRA
jgi:hypothetical protein